MDAFEDPQELGRRISAARGYAQMARPKFAKELGVSVPTLRRYEDGEVGSVGRTTAEREQLAERVMRASKCPPEIVGLSQAPADQRLDALEKELAQLRDAVVDGSAPQEELEADLERAAQLSESTGQRTGERERAAENE